MQPVEAVKGRYLTFCMCATMLTPLCLSDAFSVFRGFYSKPAGEFSEGVSEQQEQTTTHYWYVATNPCFGYMFSVVCVCVCVRARVCACMRVCVCVCVCIETVCHFIYIQVWAA